jgi:peroxiredoxin
MSLPIALGLLIALATTGMLFFTSALNSSSIENAAEFSAPLLDGTTVRLSDYRGQVVLLNFWATWCRPCRVEMPALQAAYDRYGEQGFTVLAINYAETPTQIQPFIESLGLRFPIVLDEEARLQRQFGIMGYPTSVFIGQDGSVFATHLGELNSEQLIRYIEAGLDQES